MKTRHRHESSVPPLRLGLRENVRQFSLLVVINAFVGAMVAHPSWRGSAVGVYRLWRDGGYAVGAVLAGALADVFSMPVAIGVVALLTLASGMVVAVRMPETHAPD